MGSAPYLGGGFGHFFAYAPEKWEYPINRFAMEVKRQMDVLDRQLGRPRIHRGRRLFHRRHGDLAVVWRSDAGHLLCQFGRVSGHGGLHSPQPLGPRNLLPAPPSSAGAWSTAASARPRSSCTNATTPATLTSERRTRSAADPPILTGLRRVAFRRDPHSRRDGFECNSPLIDLAKATGTRHLPPQAVTMASSQGHPPAACEPARFRPVRRDLSGSGASRPL